MVNPPTAGINQAVRMYSLFTTAQHFALEWTVAPPVHYDWAAVRAGLSTPETLGSDRDDRLSSRLLTDSLRSGAQATHGPSRAPSRRCRKALRSAFPPTVDLGAEAHSCRAGRFTYSGCPSG